MTQTQADPGGSRIYSARRRPRVALVLYCAAGVCAIAATVLFVLAARGSPAKPQVPQTTVTTAPSQAPAAPAVPVGGPDSVFDPNKYDEEFPRSREWARAGVRGGIPAREATPIVARLKPGDDIQAALDAATATGGVVWLSSGLYHVAKGLELRNNVILRGADPEQTILQTPLLEGDHVNLWPLCFHKTRRSALEDLTLSHPAPREKEPKKHHGYHGVLMASAEDCWMDNCRVRYCNDHTVSIEYCKRVTLRGNVIGGSYDKAGGRAAIYKLQRSEYVLLCNEVILDTYGLCLADNKNCVILNCFLGMDVMLETKAQPREEVLIEGLDSFHARMKRFVLPRAKHGTFYPVTGTCPTADELGAIFAPFHAERGPGDF